MNTTSKPVDVAEVAAEVVRVMFEDGEDNVYLATSTVILRRKGLYFGQSEAIAKEAKRLVEEHLAKNPTLAKHVKWQALQKSAEPAPFSHADASHRALAANEA